MAKVKVHEDERYPTLFPEDDELGTEVDDQVYEWFKRAQSDYQAAEGALARSYIENGGNLRASDWEEA